MSCLTRVRLPLTVTGTDVELAALRRDGTGTPLVFLYGFGSTKESYVDLVQHPDFAERPVLMYDAPGCGASRCADLSAVRIEFLLQVTTAALHAENIQRFHLIGHPWAA
jgi:pimeloyl-ACP methyl ester carboxylesterase